jgi:hypothetical protein
MKYTIKLLFTFLFFTSGALLFAQSEMVIDTSKNIILLKETSAGIMLHTQGWGLRFKKGYNKSEFKKRILMAELIEMQSPRQIRTINPYYTNAKSYVYGKLNSVYVLRGTYGIERMLNRKPYWGGVELRLVYEGGVSFGFAKPIYLYIIYEEFTIVEEKYNPNKHYVDNIYGRASFTKGFDEIGFYPGFHAKIGLDFDYGVYRTKVKSLEAGAIIDVFPRPVPIMAFNDPDYFFLTFYIAFNFGKRYN